MANLHKNKMAAFAYIFTVIIICIHQESVKQCEQFYFYLCITWICMLTSFSDTLDVLEITDDHQFPRWPPFSRQNLKAFRNNCFWNKYYVAFIATSFFCMEMLVTYQYKLIVPIIIGQMSPFSKMAAVFLVKIDRKIKTNADT